MEAVVKKFIRKIGRRKRAIAQVHLIEGGKGSIIVNNKEYNIYFPTEELQEIVASPMKAVGMEGKFDVSVRAAGGGIKGQAEGVRLGIARALVEHNEEWRSSLKKLGYLRRDARKKERKKYGLKGARRAPQWSKR